MYEILINRGPHGDKLGKKKGIRKDKNNKNEEEPTTLGHGIQIPYFTEIGRYCLILFNHANCIKSLLLIFFISEEGALVGMRFYTASIIWLGETTSPCFSKTRDHDPWAWIPRQAKWRDPLSCTFKNSKYQKISIFGVSKSKNLFPNTKSSSFQTQN